MAPATSKRKSKASASAMDLDSNGSQDGLGEEGDTRQPRKKSRTAQPSRSKLNEYEEDKGRQSSRDFLSWGSWHQKQVKRESDSSGDFLAKFQATVAASESDISKDIESAEERITSIVAQHSERLEKMSSSIKASKADPSATATGPSSVTSRGGNDKKRRREAHVLYHTGRQIMTACRSILERHEAANRQTQDLTPEMPHEVWRQDNEQLVQLLSYGRQFGERVIQTIVSPDHRLDELTAERNELGETGHAAIGLFNKTLEVQRKTTVGQTMRQQFNAFADIIRTVENY